MRQLVDAWIPRFHGKNRKDVVDGLDGSISFIQLADPTGSKNNRKIIWLIVQLPSSPTRGHGSVMTSIQARAGLEKILKNKKRIVGLGGVL